MVGFIKTFDQYSHKFNFSHCFSSPKKLSEDLNMKFRSKFNHGFTYDGCLHCVILKTLYNFKVKRVNEARDFSLKNVRKDKKFTRAATKINSKISNKDNSTTLMMFFCCPYCWSLL